MPTTTGVATSFIDFTRASNATVTDSDGKVKWAPSNLLTNSESFDAPSAWGLNGLLAFGSGSSANALAAPNSTTTAEYLRETNANARHYVFAVPNTLVGTNYTFRVFAKAGERTFIALGIRTTDGVTGYAAVFNLSTGAVTTTSSTGTPTNVSAPTPTAVGGGWYMLSVSMDATTSTAYLEIGLSDSGTPTFAAGMPVYTGSGTSGLYLWGAHLYRSDLAMQPNTSAYPMYNPTTPKNLVSFSEDFTNSGWAKSNTSVPPTKYLAPNGLLTANFLYANNATSGGSVFQTGGPTWTSTSVVVFDLASSGTTTGTVTSGSFTATSCTPVGDGWYRLRATKDNYTASVYAKAAGWNGFALQFFSSERMRFYPSTSTTSIAGTGDGTSGVYIWGAQLSDSASLDSYVPVYGAAVTSAAYYGPRRDFDGATLACKGLLVEEQRANSLLHTAAFDNVYWTTAQATVTPNAVGITAPDGTVTADLILPQAVNLNHGVYRTVSLSAGAYTISVYARQQNLSKLLVYSGAVGYGFDLSNNTTSPVTGVTAPSSYSMTPVGGGWYRCQINASAAPTEATFLVLQSFSSMTYLGNGADGIYLWGAQLEAGSFATSYIPTGAATATRNADVASVSTQAFPYSATEGTLVANGSFNTGIDIAAYLVQLGGSASGTGYGSSHSIFRGGASAIDVGQRLKGITYDDGNSETGSCVTAGSINVSPSKVAYGFAANNFAASVNGASVVTDSSGAMPTASTVMTLGSIRTGGAYCLNGHIRQITYLPRRISNTELVTRTSA